ncbi:hypothetical protein U1Q18_015263 [Sarracenia purpurea var. burkii]
MEVCLEEEGHKEAKTAEFLNSNKWKVEDKLGQACRLMDRRHSSFSVALSPLQGKTEICEEDEENCSCLSYGINAVGIVRAHSLPPCKGKLKFVKKTK